MTNSALPRYEGDALGGYIVARINDTLLIAAEHDLDGKMSWHDAMKFTHALPAPEDGGPGWDVPTRTQLSLMREYSAEALGMEGWYWAKDEYNSPNAWLHRISGPTDGYQLTGSKTTVIANTRPVRVVPFPAQEVE